MIKMLNEKQIINSPYQKMNIKIDVTKFFLTECVVGQAWEVQVAKSNELHYAKLFQLLAVLSDYLQWPQLPI